VDRLSFEINLERQKADPIEPSIPGPTLNDVQRAYAGDYLFSATHKAIDPATLTNINTIYVDGIGGNDANPGTFASQKLTLQNAITTAIGSFKPYVAAKRTFRERVTVNANIRIIGQAGIVPIWEAPDVYSGSQLFTPPGGAVAFRPSFGSYHILSTTFDYYGGSWDVNSAHFVTLIGGTVWNQAPTTAWNDRSGALVAPVLVKRTLFIPFIGGLPLPFTATALAGSYRATYFQLNGLNAIPDSDVLGSPTNVAAPYNQWRITTVDVCYGRNSGNSLVALNYNDKVIGTPEHSLTLYGRFTTNSTWEVLFNADMPAGLGYFLIPANANISILSSLLEWHTLKSCNSRYYLLQPHAPVAGSGVNIIDPLMAWNGFGSVLNFSPPQLRGLIGTLSYVRSRTCDIEFYKGLYYLSTDMGIYQSQDGLSGWVRVFYDPNVTPRFFHVCNNVLFCSADRALVSTLPAFETRLLYSFDGLTWNYYTVPVNYSGEVFSLGASIVGICNIIASASPYRFFQEPLLWVQNTAALNHDVHLENIDIQLRSKCGSVTGDWWASGV
jgi:hypothetical protein